MQAFCLLFPFPFLIQPETPGHRMVLSTFRVNLSSLANSRWEDLNRCLLGDSRSVGNKSSLSQGLSILVWEK